jgi:hypothetical protein
MLFVTASVLYYGALLVPILYLIFNGRRGRLAKLMLIGLLLQMFWSVVVYSVAEFNRRAGRSEWFWAYALYVPVNLASLVYYACTPLLARMRWNR